MSISARVVADSISPQGKRITTFVLTYPRFIHAELMTHRTLSRNAASSRAIPAKKVRAAVRNDPAMPIYWGANQAGMQAQTELTGWRLKLAQLLWKKAGAMMLIFSWCLEKLGLHKQIANRILEPWFNITVVATATEWANFYNLRNHELAQPEFRELAKCMLEAQNISRPQTLDWGQWHLPFVEASEAEELGIKVALQVSTARCARVSYLNHEGKRSTIEEDQKLFERLVGNDPKHASPTEHQAAPLDSLFETSGNFTGWCQHRKLIPNENLKDYKGLLIP